MSCSCNGDVMKGFTVLLGFSIDSCVVCQLLCGLTKNQYRGAGRTTDVVDLALALKAEFKRCSCFAFLQDIILMPFAFKYL